MGDLILINGCPWDRIYSFDPDQLTWSSSSLLHKKKKEKMRNKERRGGGERGGSVGIGTREKKEKEKKEEKQEKREKGLRKKKLRDN